MIELRSKNNSAFHVKFVKKEDSQIPKEIKPLFQGDYLETFFLPGEQTILYVGLGEEDIQVLQRKEAAARAVGIMKEKKVEAYSIDVSPLLKESVEHLSVIGEGLVLGAFEPLFFGEKEARDAQIEVTGTDMSQQAKEALKRGITLGEGVVWVRKLVDTPANMLRPADFAGVLTDKLTPLGVECETLDFEKIKEWKMGGLIAVGGSSSNPPCMLIMRYKGNPNEKHITGLVGKGVTVDTGGYCLKSAPSMGGIKGDMAGGAAVAGTMFALAKNNIKANVTAIIPMCENRISPGSMVPGDVITAYGGKTIEILNTDAEGRLILADAVSYGTDREGLDCVIDIATLTGAVVNMLGFSTAGLLSNDDAFYEKFALAAAKTGERYLRLPIYEEQEKMLKSKIADMKNMGESHCGTITAGIFIRNFVKSKPWIHLDIAGTASVGSPLFAFQSEGATGAGLVTMYQIVADNQR